METQCWANAQCSRREYLEVVGIPSRVNIKDFESKVRIVFNRIGVALKPDEIEACYRLYNNKEMIVKFLKRKLCQQVCEWRTNWKTLTQANLIFLKAQLFLSISKSLCSYYKMLWNKCKKLWEKKLIYRIRENGNVHRVTRIKDFKKNFPDIDINDLNIISLSLLQFDFWFLNSLCLECPWDLWSR